MSLHTLRSTPWLAKVALLWFALTLGAATASPLVSPQAQVMLCTAGGMVKVALNDDGMVSTLSAAMHCPLCATSAPPPAAVQPELGRLQALGQVLQSLSTTHIAVHSAAPPPSRGPPVFL